MRYLTLFFALALSTSACDKGLTYEQQLQKDIADIEKYLQKRGIVAESTASGLHYIITEPGSGGHPTLSSKITVNYTGKLLKNEKQFESTNGTPVTMHLRDLIEGWKEGIPLLQKGGKGTFYIPSALAYGPYGSGSVPANAPLIFDIELVNFQ